MKNYRWRIALILLAAVILLGIIAGTGRAESVVESMWVHGKVLDDQDLPVSGGTIQLEQEHQNQWYEYGNKVVMPSQWFGWDVWDAGSYRIVWKLEGYAGPDPSELEFSVPGAPTGDIVVNVKRIPVATATPTSFPVPTTLMPPTVDPTRTATSTPTVAPCLDFQQFTWAERRSIIATAASYIGRELEATLKWDEDLTLLHGLRDMMLGAPLTMRFEVMGLTARGFCQAIIVMRPVEREDCLGYGVVGWDGTQNWMAQ